MVAIHKKTGCKYLILNDNIINKTNAQDNQRMIMYCSDVEGDSNFYVRDYNEFLNEFLNKFQIL